MEAVVHLGRKVLLASYLKVGYPGSINLCAIWMVSTAVIQETF